MEINGTEMNTRECEILVVGSGAGGATVAKELSARGKDVLLVEKGERFSGCGTMEDVLRFHDVNKSTRKHRYSEEGVMLLRAFTEGGSTIVSCGNAVRCLEKEFAELGINLEGEFAEAELEMGVALIAESLLSDGSHAIMEASRELGYAMVRMPKSVNPALCTSCGHCYAGCHNAAKWTALDYLAEAKQRGMGIVYRTEVEKVLIENGKVGGVVTRGNGKQTRILSDTVILCAGAFATPVILQRSGIRNAGDGLFVDMFVNVYGLTNGLNQINEPSMALIAREFYSERGFIISPFVNHSKICRFAELGVEGLNMPLDRLLGLMIKIRDESSGCVHPDGTVSKTVTREDQRRLDEGTTIAKEILAKAGADRRSFLTSIPQGPHPGGTAAIGRTVNNNLQTEIDNLFVCDASVLPTSPGLPPILTIVALAKRLAKRLCR